MLHEVAIMKKLRHQNIVQLYEVINDPDDYRLYIGMLVSQPTPKER